MGSRTINGELAEKNMDMGVLACKIGMGTFANIVYSYSLNSVQILELVKKEIASIKLLTPLYNFLKNKITHKTLSHV